MKMQLQGLDIKISDSHSNIYNIIELLPNAIQTNFENLTLLSQSFVLFVTDISGRRYVMIPPSIYETGKVITELPP